jgi:hypothetical protein
VVLSVAWALCGYVYGHMQVMDAAHNTYGAIYSRCLNYDQYPSGSPKAAACKAEALEHYGPRLQLKASVENGLFMAFVPLLLAWPLAFAGLGVMRWIARGT